MPDRHRRTRFAAILVLLLAALIGSPAVALGDQDSPDRPVPSQEQRAAALVTPSVVLVKAEARGWVRFPDGPPIKVDPFITGWRCSGFVVNPDGWVATAGHCAEGAREALLRTAVDWAVHVIPTLDPALVTETAQANWRVEGDEPGSPPSLAMTVIAGGTAEGEALGAEVVGLVPLTEGDVALLKVQRGGLAAAELSTDTGVDLGTPVVSAGFPGTTDTAAEPTLRPVVAGGEINAKKATGTVPVYQTDAEVSEAMSGGPTADLNGAAIGVNSFGIHGQTQPFAFVAPARGLTDLMREKGVTPALGPADTAYRAGVEHYVDGNYTAAIADFDEVLSLAPGYPGAADLRTSAEQERDRYGDAAPSDSGPNWGLLGALAVLIAVGAGAVVLVRRTNQD
ncbi:S1 family peptidase [Rhodococcus maanshanensis]|uniref:Trypsin-like peptidase domain-containing protein n=1 Tax=Rhodococcus maanshanensis TaxID=183556 RepID=A0A1H7HMF6_9NOCA|nr:serine protease [Rhodococcus maanshanensis]SEK51449.1 Trypsin-like peptidase domain-containing protein [Rhodococcus maanshanensis]